MTSAFDAVDGSSTGTRVPRIGRRLRLPRFGGAAYAVNFDDRSGYLEVRLQVHGVDAAGQVVIRRQLKRRLMLSFFEMLAAMPGGDRGLRVIPLLVPRLQALGHTVRLMPPAYVKRYVKRQKNDTTDAEAICRRSRDPTCGSCRPTRSSNRAV